MLVPVPTGSLDSTSAPGHLHSVGTGTQVSFIWDFLVFFSKPPPRPDISRNRKCNKHSPVVYNYLC